MKAKWFWLYSNCKRVKEITWEEWVKIIQEDRRRKNKRLTCRVDSTDVYLRKGNKSLWVPRSQLEKILVCKGEH